MQSNLRRVVCWNCDELFRVDVSELLDTSTVIVYRGDKSSQIQKPKKKLIVKCPNCGKENEVRV
jgi:transcription elongation factor Elf1